MEAVQAAGLAKSIGVSNYLPQHLEATMKTAKVAPAINQIEFHPYLQHPELLEVQKRMGVKTSAYGPLSAGMWLCFPFLSLFEGGLEMG